MTPRPPPSTLFPYTTLFRSQAVDADTLQAISQDHFQGLVPAVLHSNGFRYPGLVVQLPALQPVANRFVFLTQGRLLQRFQRGLSPPQALQLTASRIEFVG